MKIRFPFQQWWGADYLKFSTQKQDGFKSVHLRSSIVVKQQGKLIRQEQARLFQHLLA